MISADEAKPIQYKRLALTDIMLEDDFRKTTDDPLPALSASKRGLDEFLVVEGPDDGGKYVLIHGYLRYQALVNSECAEVMCIVEQCTDPTERIIKRLRKEFHTHKRTGYELETMIQSLLTSGLSEQDIALKTDVTVSTVKKYVKTQDIDGSLRSIAQQHGVSREGLSKLWNLSRAVKPNVKESFLFRFVTKDGIKGNDVDSMVKTAKVHQFAELSESVQERCLNLAIEKTGFTTRDAKEIVFEHSIKNGFDAESHNYLYDKMINQLQFVHEIKSIPFFYDNLTQEQRQRLNELGKAALVPITPPIEWSEFPSTHPANDTEHHPFS